MASKPELTWHDPRKCWKKKRKGKVYYFGQGECTSKSDRDGYRKALSEWKQKLKELEREEHAEELVEKQDERASKLREYTAFRERMLEDAAEGDERMRRMERDYPIAALGGDVGLPEDDIEYPSKLNMWKAELGRVGPRALADMIEPDIDDLKSAPVDELIDQFTEFHRKRAVAEQIAFSTFYQFRDSINAFRRYCAEHSILSLNQLTSPIFAQYQQNVLLKINRELKPRTARDHLLKVKQFVEWLYTNEYLQSMPRSVGKGYSKVKQDAPKPIFWEVEELRLIYASASARVRLYILLGLNCGYTIADIGTLEHDHIDLEAGLIQRTRHKTQNIQQVHKLWPETITLLRQQMTAEDDEFALRSESGRVLWRDGHSDDYVTRNFLEAVLAAGVKRKRRSFKHLRPTGANIIEQEFPEYPHLSSQYLAHSEKATKKHYTLPAFAKMFEATDRMREVLGLG